MGILDRLRSLTEYSSTSPRPRRPASPWSGVNNSLGKIHPYMPQSEYAQVDRAQAMRVPAVVKSRAIITGTLAKQPLRVYDGETPIEYQPMWAQGTDTELPLWHRMAWTIDDLLFYGWSVWAREDLDGQLRAAMRVPYDRWRFDEAGHVEVQVDEAWFPAGASDIVIFAGPQEGILDIASDTIRAALAIERTIKDRSRTPFAQIEIKNTDGTQLDPEEIEELLEDYLASRREIDGATLGYTPAGYDILYHGEAQTDMLIEARNALRLDIAAFVNLPGQILDASLSTASLTYSTREGTRNELLDYSLSYWADPIASRLSQDDIVAPGLRSRFDLTEFVALVNTPNAPITED